MAEKKQSRRLISIDMLRGVAVLAVVFSHLPFSVSGLSATAIGEVYPPQPIPTIIGYGHLGVQLFLLISGFCIHMRWARAADLNMKVSFIPFWKRRLARLYPPYFIVLSAALFATFALNSFVLTPAPGLGGAFGYESTSTFVVDLFVLVFMLQNLTPAAWRVSNGPFWSLALEEQLYLLYFPLLWMRRNWGWPATFAVAGIGTLVWRGIGALAFESTPFFWFLVGPAFWLPWALGAYAVEIYFGHQKAPWWSKSAIVGVVFFACGVLLDMPEGMAWENPPFARIFDELFYSLSFFVLINFWVLRELDGKLGNSLLVRGITEIGVWSYSIYLVHLLVMVPVKRLAVSIGLPELGVLGIRLGSGLIVGYIFYRLVEVRFHVLARKVKAEMKRIK